MSEIGHSTLLKFLVNRSKMSEESGKTDTKINSKVPGEQALRGDYIQELQTENAQNVALKDYSISPVIKVTKEESTFTKGDLKVQKVIVTEDISKETKSTTTDSATPTEVQTEEHSEVSSVTINTEDNTQTITGDQKVVYKVITLYPIPKVKFNQVVGKIKKEEEIVKEVKDEAEIPIKVTEAVPRLQNEKNVLQELSRPEPIKQESPKVDDEFDRIYDEIFENGPPSGNFPSPGKIEDPFKLETKFEEIIHAYDEQKAYTNTEKVKSKIPLLKRKSEHDIFAAKETIRKNSLKKRNSVDDTKCRLPVRLTKEKQNFDVESPKNQKTVSAKNVAVIKTVNTNISKSVTTITNNQLHQKDNKKHTTQETEFTSKSEVSKSKIPTHLKKIIGAEKVSDIQTSKISSQLSVEKKSEVNKNETHYTKTVVTEDAVKTLNVKDNISNTKTESSTITHNVQKVPNANDNNKKDTTLNITVEKDNGNRNQVTETGTKTHIDTKVVVINSKLINDSTQNEKPLDAINSKKDFQLTNKQSEKHFAKTEVEKIHANETNSSVSINQEIRETVKIVSSQISNSETKNIQHDQQDKINDNITKNIPKDILNISVSPHAKNALQEIKYDKNELSIENMKISDNINLDRESATNITKRVNSKIQNTVSPDLSKSYNEINSNNISQDYIINKLVSESTQKSLDSFLKKNEDVNSINKDVNSTDKDVNSTNKDVNSTNKEVNPINKDVNSTNKDVTSTNKDVNLNNKDVNSTNKDVNLNNKDVNSTYKDVKSTNKDVTSTNVDTKQDKAALITNQQPEAKNQKQELTEEVAKNLTPKVHPGKSDNIAQTISTEIKNNDNKIEVNKNNTINEDIAIACNKIDSSENNGKAINELEEEDVIILKGKVNRIISRLDSKEFKVNKCEPDDLALEESVVSKIALFEQSKSMDTTQKATIAKAIPADEINLDKPKIVDEVLKIENSSLHSDSKFSYDTFLNYKNTIKNNISVNENEAQTTSQDKFRTKINKLYQANINLNKFNKTNENKVVRSEDEVLLKNEKANRKIIDEYKINKEIDLDMRRAKSLAELNYDGVQGRVRQMVVRMNSIDKMALERREHNEVRKKTRHGSVSERIALFEQDANEPTVHLMKKVTPIRMESVSTTASPSKPEEFTPALNEEELAKRISDLAQVRVTYGQYDNMTYIELSDGGRLPSLAVGTALLDSQLIKPIIKAAIDLGYRAIDTAYVYGNEQAVGEAIREKIKDGTVKREELFILAKLWSTNHRQDLVLRACRQSLDVMGLDYFDLYLIHNPMSFKEGPNPVPKIANVLQYSEHDYLEAWFGIESLIKQGLVKRGGVSNFNSLQVERVLDKGKIKPVVNQVECHPYLSQARLQDFLSSRGIALSCFGCLGSSGTPRALRSSLPPVINDPLVRTMAAGLGVTPAQLLISYQLSLDRNVVVKASSAAHLWDNLRALDLRLAPAHAAGLAALNRNKRTFTFEGMGDTHKNYPFKIPF